MLIIGAGGHAREVLNILSNNLSEAEKLAFYDDTINAPRDIYGQFDVLHSIEETRLFFKTSGNRFCLGIGNPLNRFVLVKTMVENGGEFASIVDKTALINDRANIKNADIMPLTFIGPDVEIAFGVLINTRVNVHHDVIIGEYTEVSPQAVLLGGCIIGSFTRIGSNAVVLPKLKIGNNVVIGAGAVITKDIPDNSLVMGVPGKIIKELKPLVW
jgi:sugar O-acyltransferase (sialic acid O-acetyltransferase NeuD family)